MKLFSGKPKRRNSLVSLSNPSSGSSLPPISQYVPSNSSGARHQYGSQDYSTDDDFDDDETRTNTLRNSTLLSPQTKSILKKRSSMTSLQNPGNSNNNNANANAAAAAALSRSNSLKNTSIPSHANNLPSQSNYQRPQRKSNFINSSTRRTSLHSANVPVKKGTSRSYSLTRIDEQQALPPKNTPHRHKPRTSAPIQKATKSNQDVNSYNQDVNMYNPKVLSSPRTSSILSNSRAQSFTSLPPIQSRNLSMTSALSNSSFDMNDMTIQSTTTKRGNMLVKQTKIIDSQGVTRRIITKTIKKVGNYEVVKSNIINLSNGEHSGSILSDSNAQIDELGKLEELDDDYENLFAPQTNSLMGNQSNRNLLLLSPNNSEINHHFEGFDEAIDPEFGFSNQHQSFQQNHLLSPLQDPLQPIEENHHPQSTQQNQLHPSFILPPLSPDLDNPSGTYDTSTAQTSNNSSSETALTSNHPYANFVENKGASDELTDKSYKVSEKFSLQPEDPHKDTPSIGAVDSTIPPRNKLLDKIKTSGHESEDDTESHYSDALSHPVILGKTSTSALPSKTPSTEGSFKTPSIPLASDPANIQKLMKEASSVVSNDSKGANASKRSSILAPSRLENFDIASAKSGKSNKSHVSFKGVEYIDDMTTLPKKLSESEMYEAALKAAHAKVFGTSNNSSGLSKSKPLKTNEPSRSSFERNRENKVANGPQDSVSTYSNNGDRTFSLRGGTAQASIKSPVTHEDEADGSPRLRKKPLKSEGLRGLSSIGSKIKAGYVDRYNFNNYDSAKKNERLVDENDKASTQTTTKASVKHDILKDLGFKRYSLKEQPDFEKKSKLSRKEKKYLKEKAKLENMNLSDEIKAIQQKKSRKGGLVARDSPSYRGLRKNHEKVSDGNESSQFVGLENDLMAKSLSEQASNKEQLLNDEVEDETEKEKDSASAPEKKRFSFFRLRLR